MSPVSPINSVPGLIRLIFSTDGSGFSIKQVQKKLSKTYYKPPNLYFARIPYYRVPNLPLLVGFAESHMIEKCVLNQLGETLTVVLEWFVKFPIQRETDNSYPLYTALLSDWRVSDSSPLAYLRERTCELDIGAFLHCKELEDLLRAFGLWQGWSINLAWGPLWKYRVQRRAVYQGRPLADCFQSVLAPKATPRYAYYYPTQAYTFSRSCLCSSGVSSTAFLSVGPVANENQS